LMVKGSEKPGAAQGAEQIHTRGRGCGSSQIAAGQGRKSPVPVTRSCEEKSPDAVLGHARPGEGLGRYSAGSSEEQRIEAVKAITLPVS
jgi:hypothetical protein